jgi:sec-independent protein translocase protein TatB
MFDIGWSELLVIAVVAIVVVGPKDLPRLMRSFGHYAGKLRRAASDFQRQFEQAMRESEVEEVRKAIESAKVEPLNLNAPIDQPMMLPRPAATEASAEPKPAAKPQAKPKRKRAPAKAKASAKAKPPARRKPNPERAT